MLPATEQIPRLGAGLELVLVFRLTIFYMYTDTNDFSPDESDKVSNAHQV